MKSKSVIIIILTALSALFFTLFIGKVPLALQIDNTNRNSPKTQSASNSVMINWNRTWGGIYMDGASGVAVDSADNIYLAGSTNSYGAGIYDMVLVKYDCFGTLQWNLTWGGSGSLDFGMDVAVDSADNIYLVGSADGLGTGSEDMILVKFNSSGIQQWNRTWGGSSPDRATNVVVDLADNIYLGGTTESFGAGSNDMVLVKFNSSGIQQWNVTWGGISWDVGSGLAKDSSNNVYLTGSTDSFGTGGYEVRLVKYDTSGIQQWNRTCDGLADTFGAVAVDSFDNIYLGGYTDIFGAGLGDVALIKYDSSGKLQWNTTWGGGSLDIAIGVGVDSVGSVYLGGYTESFGTGLGDVALLKYDSSGTLQWNTTWGGIKQDFGSDIAIDSADNIYLTGYTESFGIGQRDVFLVKYVLVNKGEELAISGYNLVLFIGVVGVITVIYLKKIKS